MESLANTYALIQELETDVDVMFSNKQPSYIRRLAGESSNKKLIVLYKKRDPLKENSYKSPTADSPSENQTETKDDLDLTGSPLKDSCNVELIDAEQEFTDSNDMKLWNESEELMLAIPSDTGRTILQSIIDSDACKNDAGYVWVLCDNEKENGNKGAKQLIFGLNLNNGWHTTTDVQFMGYTTYNEKLFANLINGFNQMKRSSSKPKKHTINIQKEFKLKPNLMVVLDWPLALDQPNFKDYNQASVHVVQTVSYDNEYSITADFWRQIKLLNMIKNDIIQFKRNEDDIEYRWGSGISLTVLRNKIMETLSEIPTDYEYDGLEPNKIAATIEKVKKRQSFDVTDSLWNLLKCCTCYRDLKAAFNIIFQSASNFNVANMPVNKNRVANMIRDIANKQLLIPSLAGTEPLELLLEIGIEKSYNDLRLIFNDNKLMDLTAYWEMKELLTEAVPNKSGIKLRKSLIDAYGGKWSAERKRKTSCYANWMDNKEFESVDEINGSNYFDSIEIDVKLAKLTRIFICLEHLMLLQANLGLQRAMYSSIATELLQRPLIPVSYIQPTSVDTFKLALQLGHVMDKINGILPYSINLELDMETKLWKNRTVFNFCVEFIFPPNTFKSPPERDVEPQEHFYHILKYEERSTHA